MRKYLLSIMIACFCLGFLYLIVVSLKPAAGKSVKPGVETEYVNKGHDLFSKGKFEAAEVMFNKVLKINPKNDDAYVMLGHIYSGYKRQNNDMKMYEKAKEMYNKELKINPNNGRAYVGLGDIH